MTDISNLTLHIFNYSAAKKIFSLSKLEKIQCKSWLLIKGFIVKLPMKLITYLKAHSLLKILALINLKQLHNLTRTYFSDLACYLNNTFLHKYHISQIFYSYAQLKPWSKRIKNICNCTLHKGNSVPIFYLPFTNYISLQFQIHE